MDIPSPQTPAIDSNGILERELITDAKAALDELLGLLFSGGLDSGALLLCLHDGESSTPLAAIRPGAAGIDGVRRLIAPRNLAGLADPARRRLYPADVEALVAATDILGLTSDEMRTRLPRLRGEPVAGD